MYQFRDFDKELKITHYQIEMNLIGVDKKW